MKALIVDDELRSDTAFGRASRDLVTELRAREVEVAEAASAEDGLSVIVSDASIQAILLDWSLGDDDPRTDAKAKHLLQLIRSRNTKIPIFLMTERELASSLPPFQANSLSPRREKRTMHRLKV